MKKNNIFVNPEVFLGHLTVIFHPKHPLEKSQ
jgi:hypothetical protein